MFQAKQARVACTHRLDIELLLCHDRLSAQHLIGLVQTEDRHVNIFDCGKQQARDERHLNRYGIAVDAVQTPNRIQQIVLGNAKQVGIIWARITLGTREDADGRLAARSTNRLAKASCSFVGNGHFLRHKRALSADASNLPAPNQLIDSTSNGQACRTKFLGEVFFGRNHGTRGIYTAFDTLFNATSYAHINRGGIYCFSHCSPATLLMPFFSPLSAKRNFVGKITDLQCSTKRMSLSNSIVLS